jgi:hypothetical protein
MHPLMVGDWEATVKHLIACSTLLLLGSVGAIEGCSDRGGGMTGSGGHSGTGGLGHAGSMDAGTGAGGVDAGGAETGDAPSIPRDGGGIGGAGAGGASGAGGANAPILAQLCGGATSGQDGGSVPGLIAGLTFNNQTYASDPRVAPYEAIFSFINSVDDPHLQTFRLHNGGAAAVQLTHLDLVGNPAAPAAGATPNPGPSGGTLFPLTYNQVSLPAAFEVTTTATLPMTLDAGADLEVTVHFLSTRTSPPDRMLNIGGQAVSAVLVASSPTGCATAGLYGVALWNNSETPPDATTGLPSNNWARYEPTFGQIVATLGYKVNLGAQFIQLLNTNDMSLPGIGFSTDEVQVHRFVKADPAAPVELSSVGRFSPPTDCAFGWYPVGSLTGTAVGAGGGADGGTVDGGGTGGTGGGGVGGATGSVATVTDAQPAAIPPGSTFESAHPAALRVVATMQASPLGSDWNRSNGSELVLPPLRADSNATTFDPGASTVFGLWAFTNQRSVGGVSSAGVAAPNVGNGDYVYSEDALNIDGPHSHRVRVYPLRDRGGTLVPHAYLLGWEEATNGDYQDYVFVLRNAAPAP